MSDDNLSRLNEGNKNRLLMREIKRLNKNLNKNKSNKKDNREEVKNLIYKCFLAGCSFDNPLSINKDCRIAAAAFVDKIDLDEVLK